MPHPLVCIHASASNPHVRSFSDSSLHPGILRREPRLKKSILLACLLGLSAARAHADTRVHRVLNYTKANGYHADFAINGLSDLLKKLSAEQGFQIDSTDDSSRFTLENLKRYDVVVFNSCSGFALPMTQQRQAFQQYMEEGGGYVGGINSSDSHGYWPWYDQMLGTRFQSHFNGKGRVRVDSAALKNPEMTDFTHAIPEQPWAWEDVWFSFRSNPRADSNVSVLLTLDESYFTDPLLTSQERMGDHPISWTRKLPPGANGKQGRVFYVGFGWWTAVYQQPAVHDLFLNALRWAAGDAPLTIGNKEAKPKSQPPLAWKRSPRSTVFSFARNPDQKMECFRLDGKNLIDFGPPPRAQSEALK